jgi:hypothetical protein
LPLSNPLYSASGAIDRSHWQSDSPIQLTEVRLFIPGYWCHFRSSRRNLLHECRTYAASTLAWPPRRGRFRVVAECSVHSISSPYPQIVKLSFTIPRDGAMEKFRLPRNPWEVPELGREMSPREKNLRAISPNSEITYPATNERTGGQAAVPRFSLLQRSTMRTDGGRIGAHDQMEDAMTSPRAPEAPQTNKSNQATTLEKLYRAIGISAVAAALRYSGSGAAPAKDSGVPEEPKNPDDIAA